MSAIAQKKHDIMNVIADSNVKTNDIAKALNYSVEHTSRLRTKAKKNQLLTTKRIKSAIRTVDYFITTENYQTDDRIKPSDALNASRIVIDRAFPIVENISPNQNWFNFVLNCESKVSSNTLQESSNPLQLPSSDVIDVSNNDK